MDSGWIKALELPAKITGALFVASCVILLIDGTDSLSLSDIGTWARPLITIILVGSGCLFVFSAMSTAWESTTGVRTSWLRKRWYKKRRQDFIDDIRFLTERERKILGYLRHYNQKRFTGTQDGGHARTLVAKGYVHFIGVEGQGVDPMNVPYEVADYVWEVIEARPNDFPHQPVFSSGQARTEVHPWRVPMF